LSACFGSLDADGSPNVTTNDANDSMVGFCVGTRVDDEAGADAFAFGVYITTPSDIVAFAFVLAGESPCVSLGRVIPAIA